MADKKLNAVDSATTVANFYGNNGGKDVQIPLATAASVLAEAIKISVLNVEKTLAIDEIYKPIPIYPTEGVLCIISTSTKSAIYVASRSLSGYGFFAKICGELDDCLSVIVDSGINEMKIKSTQEINVYIKILKLKR